MHQIPLKVKDKLLHLLDTSESINEVNGGLFNYVYKINSAQNNVTYLKIFTDLAKSNNFPPLPTSPEQRCFIAVESHKTAYESSKNNAMVNIPKLLDYSLEDCFVLMEESSGTLLFDSLINHKSSLKSILNSYKICMRWLANMHTSSCKNSKKIDNSSYLFKKYKIELQYVKLVPLLSIKVQPTAGVFIDNYLNSKIQLVHGDLNSRNILIDSNDGLVVNIIDFEQGHMGYGLYDVAYLCSELVIRLWISNETDVERHIGDLLTTYSNKLSDEEIIKYRLHLAFQVLYRLVGPSRSTWSGHLIASEVVRIKLWAINQLEELFSTL